MLMDLDLTHMGVSDLSLNGHCSCTGDDSRSASRTGGVGLFPVNDTSFRPVPHELGSV